MSPYPIVSVAPTDRVGDEPMGTKEKFWWQDEGGTKWLFKYARPNTGEHWSEKIAAEVGTALGVPCAEVQLAECEGSAGCVSRSFITHGSVVLVHGNELLQKIDASYPITQLRGVSKHTVPAVLHTLEPMQPPKVDDALPSAADWFVGYLLLDALIVNSDRHHENWGVLHLPGPEGIRRLAPSYDHASSLGRELRDAKRQTRLETKDSRQTIEHYVLRARSSLYADALAERPLHPRDAFLLASGRRPSVGQLWLARLQDLREDTLEGIVQRIPESSISHTARTFALQMLLTARRLILESANTTPR